MSDAHDRLKVSEERLREAVECLGIGIFDHNLRTGEVYRSPEHRALCGWNDEEAVRESEFLSQVQSEDRTALELALAKGREPAGTGLVEADFRMLRRTDRALLWVRLRARTTFGSERGVRCALRTMGTVLDITAHKQAERALRESEERLRLAIMAANQGLYDLDVQTGRATVSPEYAKILGYDPATFEETNTSWIARLHPEDHERVSKIFGDYLAGRLPSYQVEFRQQTAQGRKWVLSLGKIVDFDATGRPLRMLGTHTDITERKEAEEALRESENHLRRSQSVARLGSYDFDVQCGVWISSPVLDEIFGIGADYARTVDGWGGLIHPEDRAATMEHLLTHVLRGCQRFEREYRILRRSDGAERWVRGFGELDFDSAGRPIRMIGTIQDITESKRNELVLQTSLEEKDALLRELHHRVKNNLQVVSSLLSLKAIREQDEKVLTALRDTQGRVHAMALLHEALYRSENLARVDFGPYVKHLCAHLARAYGQNVEPVALKVNIEDLQLDLERAVPCGLIVSEAVTNAFKHAFASRADGRIEVAARSVDGKWVEFRIVDNGIGLPPAFDPGRAATLGFQLLSRLAQQLEGRLRVESGPGTSVGVTFPLAMPARTGATASVRESR